MHNHSFIWNYKWNAWNFFFYISTYSQQQWKLLIEIFEVIISSLENFNNWNSVFVCVCLNSNIMCTLLKFTSWSFSVLLNSILSVWRDCSWLLFVSTDTSSISTKPTRPVVVHMIRVSKLECWTLASFSLFLKLKSHVMFWSEE